jgi:hypothetical protein
VAFVNVDKQELVRQVDISRKRVSLDDYAPSRRTALRYCRMVLLSGTGSFNHAFLFRVVFYKPVRDCERITPQHYYKPRTNTLKAGLGPHPFNCAPLSPAVGFLVAKRHLTPIWLSRVVGSSVVREL